MKSIINWIKGTFSDVNGNPSSKRQMAFMYFILTVYAVYVDKDISIVVTLCSTVLALLAVTVPDNFGNNSRNRNKH